MEHDDEHGPHSDLSDIERRVRALETLLTEKGYIDPAALDVLIDTYQTKVGPRNGARVVARAWIDAEFRERLLRDATSAVAELEYSGRQGEHIVAVRTPRTGTTSGCVLSAAATRGRCSVCRPSGTRVRRTARGPCATPEAYWPNSA